MIMHYNNSQFLKKLKTTIANVAALEVGILSGLNAIETIGRIDSVPYTEYLAALQSIQNVTGYAKTCALDVHTVLEKAQSTMMKCGFALDRAGYEGLNTAYQYASALHKIMHELNSSKKETASSD